MDDRLDLPRGGDSPRGVWGALLLVYVTPIAAAAVTVSLRTFEQAGWMSLYGLGIPLAYANGFVAVVLPAYAGVKVGGAGVGRVAWSAAYAMFGAAAYCVAAFGFGVVAVFVFMGMR